MTKAPNALHLTFSRNGRILLLLLALLACISFDAVSGEHPALTAKDLATFTPLADSIAHSAALVLYEGLPHPAWETAQYKEELANKKTIRIHGYAFYERTLPIAAADTAPLRRLCTDPASYWSYGGPKLCGGYHPDYCLVWKDGDRVCELLICFGCHEMKFHDSKHKFIADVREAPFTRFQELLQKYHEQRPKPARL